MRRAFKDITYLVCLTFVVVSVVGCQQNPTAQPTSTPDLEYNNPTSPETVQTKENREARKYEVLDNAEGETSILIDWGKYYRSDLIALGDKIRKDNEGKLAIKVFVYDDKRAWEDIHNALHIQHRDPSQSELAFSSQHTPAEYVKVLTQLGTEPQPYEHYLQLNHLGGQDEKISYPTQ